MARIAIQKVLLQVILSRFPSDYGSVGLCMPHFFLVPYLVFRDF